MKTLIKYVIIITSNNRTEIWWIRKVLIDEINWDEWLGHTDNMKQIWGKIEWKNVSLWEFVNVEITGAWEFKLVWIIK